MPTVIVLNGYRDYERSEIGRFLVGPYFDGCSFDLKHVVTSTILYEDNGYPSTRARFFLPSLTQLNLGYQEKVRKNARCGNYPWEYFESAPTNTESPCIDRTLGDPIGNPCSYLTRTLETNWSSMDHLVWTVGENGGVSRQSHRQCYGIAPACLIA